MIFIAFYADSRSQYGILKVASFLIDHHNNYLKYVLGTAYLLPTVITSVASIDDIGANSYLSSHAVGTHRTGLAVPFAPGVPGCSVEPCRSSRPPSLRVSAPAADDDVTAHWYRCVIADVIPETAANHQPRRDVHRTPRWAGSRVTRTHAHTALPRTHEATLTDGRTGRGGI